MRDGLDASTAEGHPSPLSRQTSGESPAVWRPPSLLKGEELLKSFLKRFETAYRRFEKAGFESFRGPYWRRYSRPDEPVRLRTAQGIVQGIARGVDARGALVVESAPAKESRAGSARRSEPACRQAGRLRETPSPPLLTIWEGEIV